MPAFFHEALRPFSRTLRGFCVFHISIPNTPIPPPDPVMVRSRFAPVEVDVIEELRLRRWARENYVLSPERDAAWHPIILDEMNRKDGEFADNNTLAS